MQKALTEWKTLFVSPSQKPNIGIKRNESSSAPANSNAKVKAIILCKKRNRRSYALKFIDWAKITRSRGVTVRLISAETSMAIDIKPSPPIWMSAKITPLPNMLHSVAVSRTISPVTQVALVAVKSASIGSANAPSADEIGSISSSPPMRITTKKPSMIVLVGDIAVLNSLLPNRFILPARGADVRVC